ncbi:hypothetical protein [Terrihalobacillus insolitus]|uniref:hypothetical protein n=1 Tax=Terrihalobacillus insolitus TaxID=2950438 RepID=UPI002342391D|nr:hypothetical protein [Terrihalobacillus insolitus]MDC3412541.1 hypothetical protein [Terrihalobacillus insolitus]
MEMNEKRYEDIINKIQLVVHNYYGMYNLKPNKVTLGQEDYYELLKTNSKMLSIPVDEDKVTLMGMDVEVVSHKTKISVGYMEDIE